MWYKILLSIIVIAFISIIQITVLGSLGNYFSSFNLLLAVLVISLFLVDFNWVIYFTIGAGLVLDIYSSLPFGIFMISIFLAISISNFLLFDFFTNRSFYSVVFVGWSTVLLFNIIFLISTGIVYLLGLSDFYINNDYWLKLVYQVINISIVLISLFFVINLFSKKFKPNFIRS